MSRKGKTFTIIKDNMPNPQVNKRNPSKTSSNYGTAIARSVIAQREAALGTTKNTKPFVRLAHETHEWLGFHLQPGMYFGLDVTGYFVARPQDSRVKSISNILYEFAGMPVYRISECGEWACKTERSKLTASLHTKYLQRSISGVFPEWDRREGREKIEGLYQYNRPAY